MQTKKKIIAALTERHGISPEEIEDKTKFTDDLGLDSLDVVELVMDLEREFNITIDDNRIDGFVAVKDVVEYVERLIL
jgi:acyl carrier protein